MAVGATPEDRVFGEVKRLCYAGLDEATLLREVADRLRRAVPFEGYCAHAVDPLSGLIANAVQEEMGGEKEARFFFEYLYFADDVNEYNSMAKNRRPVALLSEATDGRLERSLRYRELMEPLGFGYELRSVFTTGVDLWGAIDVRRERGRPDFEPREVRLFRQVAPHLGAGLRAAVLRSQSPPEKGGDGTLACLSSTTGGGSRITPWPQSAGLRNSKTPTPVGMKAAVLRLGGKARDSRGRCGRW